MPAYWVLRFNGKTAGLDRENDDEYLPLGRHLFLMLTPTKSVL
jgi:hypothetical protein